MQRHHSFIATDETRRRARLGRGQARLFRAGEPEPLDARTRSWRAVGAGWAICLALFLALAGAGGVHRFLARAPDGAAEARPAVAAASPGRGEAEPGGWRALLDAVARRG